MEKKSWFEIFEVTNLMPKSPNSETHLIQNSSILSSVMDFSVFSLLSGPQKSSPFHTLVHPGSDNRGVLRFWKRKPGRKEPAQLEIYPLGLSPALNDDTVQIGEFFVGILPSFAKTKEKQAN